MARYGGKRYGGYSKYRRFKKTYRRAFKKSFKSGKYSRGFTRRAGFYGRYNLGLGKSRPWRRITEGDIEKKYFDKNFRADTGTSLTQDGALLLDGTGNASLNIVSQGTGPQNCLGLKFKIKSIQLKGFVLTQGGPETGGDVGSYPAVLNPPNVKLYLILDTQCNGTQAQPSDIWAPDPFTSDVTYNSFLRLDQGNRFRILKEFIIDFNGNNGWGVYNDYNIQASSKAIFIEYYKKCDIDVEISSTGGNVSTLRTNNIFMSGFSFYTDGELSTYNQYPFLPIVNISTRIRFTDM